MECAYGPRLRSHAQPNIDASMMGNKQKFTVTKLLEEAILRYAELL